MKNYKNIGLMFLVSLSLMSVSCMNLIYSVADESSSSSSMRREQFSESFLPSTSRSPVSLKIRHISGDEIVLLAEEKEDMIQNFANGLPWVQETADGKLVSHDLLLKNHKLVSNIGSCIPNTDDLDCDGFSFIFFLRSYLRGFMNLSTEEFEETPELRRFLTDLLGEPDSNNNLWLNVVKQEYRSFKTVLAEKIVNYNPDEDDQEVCGFFGDELASGGNETWDSTIDKLCVEFAVDIDVEWFEKSFFKYNGAQNENLGLNKIPLKFILGNQVKDDQPGNEGENIQKRFLTLKFICPFFLNLDRHLEEFSKDSGKECAYFLIPDLSSFYNYTELSDTNKILIFFLDTKYPNIIIMSNEHIITGDGANFTQLIFKKYTCYDDEDDM